MSRVSVFRSVCLFRQVHVKCYHLVVHASVLNQVISPQWKGLSYSLLSVAETVFAMYKTQSDLTLNQHLCIK